MIGDPTLGKGAQAVYDQLRVEIMHGDLPARSVLQQVELADRFSVSRTPVREALQQLARDGFVELLSGQTARVVAISLQDRVEILQIRAWLEVPTLLLALQRSRHDVELDEILNAVRDLEEKPTSESCESLLALDEMFHRWALRTAGNQRVERSVGQLLDVMYRERRFSVAHDYVAVRENLLALQAAIAQDDTILVQSLFTEHIVGNNPLLVPSLS
ncbi:MAG: GntR family transcriptional regulator [Chloroflexi bacterium]|nr:GntR family transcriptional regulator [Chloroflexota bacterium]